MKNSTPNSAKKLSSRVAEPIETDRSRKIRSGTSGCSVRDSISANSASTTSPPATKPIVRAEPQPQLWALITPKTTRNRPQAAVFLRAGQVIRDNPAALATNAEALMVWEQGMRSEIQRRLGDTDDSLRPRLLLGTAMLAFRVALDRWADLEGAGPARAVLEEALDAVEPGATALERAAG